MVESILVYCILAFAMICYGLEIARLPINRRPKTISFREPIVYVPILFFTFIFGCRYGVGVDYPSYLSAYLYGEDHGWEFLFQLLTTSLSSINFHYSVYFGFIAFVEIFCIYYSLKNYRYLYPIIPFFIIVGFWFLSLCNILRQQLAACVFLVAVLALSDKKIWKYYIICLIACLFHKSALLLFLIYPLYVKKDSYFSNKIINLILFVVAVVVSTQSDLILLYIEPLFSFFGDSLDYGNKYSFEYLAEHGMENRNKFGNNTGLAIYTYFFKYLPVIFYRDKMVNFYKSRYFNIIFDLWFVGVLSNLMFSSSIVLTRPFIYFQNYIYILPAFFFFYCMKSRNKTLKVIMIFMIILYVGLLYNLLRNGSVNTSEFTFFWQH